MSAPRPGPPAETLLANALWVRRLASRLLRDAHLAEDVTQEVVLALLQNPPRSASDPAGPRAWLRRVTHNLALRAASREAQRPRVERGAARAEADPAAGDATARLERHRRLTETVLALEEPYRSTVVMRYFDDLPPREIARRQGVPPATVRQRLSRALRQLRARLEADAEPGADGGAWALALVPLVNPPGAVPPTLLPLEIAMAGSKKFVAVAGLCLTAIAGGLGLTALLADAGGSSAPTLTRDVSADAPAEIVEPAAEILEAARGGRREAAESADPAGGEATEGERFAVYVIDGETGRPVPGATLHWARERVVMSADQTSWMQVSRDLEEVLVAHGERRRTDAEGTVHVERSDQPLYLACRHGGLWAETLHRPGEVGPLKLELRPDRTLVFRVIDPDARAVADVLVVLYRAKRNGGSTVWTGVTGADGMATLPHVDHRLAGRREPGELWAYAHVPGAERHGVEIDESALPDAPIELLMPATGRIVVTLSDAAGSAFEHPALVQLMVRNTHVFLPPLMRRTETGRVELPHVALGARFELRAWATGEQEELRAPMQTIDGPLAAAETVEATLVFDVRHPVLAGTLTDAVGRPLATRNLRAVWQVEEPQRRKGERSHWSLTDEKGRFRVPLSQEVEADAAVVLVLLVPEEDGRAAHFGRRTVPGPLTAGIVDLGLVALRPAPLLAAGRVVDDAGRAVPDAQVGIATRGVGEAPAVDVPDGWAVRVWDRRLRDLATQTDADGRFRIHGDPARLDAPERRPGVSAWKTGFLGAHPALLHRGATDLELVLQRPGAIEGRLVMLPGIEATSLSWRLAGYEAERERWFGTGGVFHSTYPEPDGRFRIDDLPPEPVTLELVLAGEPDPVYALQDVRVEPGRTLHDPRFAAIRLADLLDVTELEIVDVEGRPIPEGTVIVRRADAPGDVEHERRLRFEQGHLTIVSRGPLASLSVSAEGYSTRIVETPAARERAVLERAHLVRLLLDEAVALPAEGVELGILLVPTVDDSRSSTFTADGLRVDGPPTPRAFEPSEHFGPTRRELSLALPRPGPYRLNWIVRGEVGTLIAGETIEVEVVAGRSEQTFTVAPPAEPYAAALEKIGAEER